MATFTVNSSGGTGVFTTIQAAIDAAASAAPGSHTITVLPGLTGVYAEQLLIDGINDLTIEADGAVSIVAPAGPLATYATDPVTGEAIYAVATVTNIEAPLSPFDPGGVFFAGFTIDGDQRGADVPAGAEFVGVAFVDATGGVLGSTVTGVRHATLNGVQSGTGVLATDDSGDFDFLTVNGSTIEEFQKNGVTGRGVFLEVSESSVNGAGATSVIAQNGVQISSDGGGIIADNTISGFGYTGGTFTAAGVLLLDSFAIEVSGNTITGATTDGAVGVALSNSELVSISSNAFVSLEIGVQEDIPQNEQVAGDYVDNALGQGVDANVFTGVVTGYDLVGDNTFAVDRSDAGTPLTDVFDGGPGDDTFAGAAGEDFLIGNGGIDDLSGDDNDDVLNGGADNDTLDGGAGVDAAVYAGDFADFTVTVANDDTVTVADDAPASAGDEGTDTLTNIEVLIFGDQFRYPYFANADTAATNQDVDVAIDVLANDGDQNNDGVVDGDDVAVVAASVELDDADDLAGKTKTVAGEGVYTVNVDGTITFNPDAGFSGQTTPVFYSVADADGARSLPTAISVDVTPVATSTTIVARIGGTGTSGQPPQFTVTIDGQVFGPLSVTNPAATRGEVVFDDYTFVVPTGSVSTVVITYLNDGRSGTIDRNLYVDNISVNGTVLEAEIDGVYSRVNGVIIPNTEAMLWDGTMVFDDIVVTPPPETTTVVARIGGTGTDALPPEFTVTIDGQEFGPLSVVNPAPTRSAVTFTDYSFEVPTASVSSVVITYLNDGRSGSIDRNLYVDKIIVDGTSYEAEIDGVYSRTNGVVIPNTEAMLWDGTMVFDGLSDNPPPDTITVVARVGGTGTEALPSRFTVTINGQDFGAFDVTDPAPNGGAVVYDNFEFEVAATDVTSVEIAFINDGRSGAIDRNLYVDNISVDGMVFEAEIDGVYSRTNGVIIPDTEIMYWAGVMAFDDLVA